MLTYITNECMPLEKMLARVQKQHPGDSYLLVEKAYKFAEQAHAGQVRKSGEPYFIHPVSVASILTDLMIDAPTIAAGFLHDTVEDCPGITLDTIRQEFGDEVAQLVDGVTKLDKLDFTNREEQKAESLRKMILAMSKDIRVVVIKLADRLHNMRTLRFQPEDRQKAIAHETLDIYAPLAHRLGINSVKSELEDLSFKYIDPVAFHEIAQLVGQRRVEREESIRRVISELSEKLDEQHIHYDIDGRPKHFYSIYRKMVLQNKPFEQIYDLIAIRVLVDTIPDCYAVLGIVHTLWNQIPGRFKDYISVPKANMYQSLHTTVVGGRKMPFPFEVQIRTWEMHRVAEYGIAAHWRYKETGASRPGAADNLDAQLAWLRQMVDWQDETEDSREFLKSLKMDLDDTEVFVFTPKGEVMSLRAGSTPVDFAYAIHTEVGNHCVGAKVNGSIVPLSYQLQVGDRVEVLTQKSASPSRDWLNIVKTPSARSKIRSYFSKITRSDDMQMGRDMLVREMRKHGLGLSSAQSMRALKLVAEALGFKDPDEMYVHIGTGKEKAQHVTNRLLKILVDKGNEEAEKPTVGTSASSTGIMAPMLTSVKRPKKHETHSSQGIVVKGVDDVLVRLSRCCNPVPGDDILGFVTRGRGVSVHRADCPNALDLKRHPERIIEVEWEGTPTAATYQVEIYIEALDRMNLLLDVTRVISEMGANVLSCNTTTHRDGMVEMRFLFQLSDLAVIERMTKRLSAIDGVFDARRMMPQGSSKKG